VTNEEEIRSPQESAPFILLGIPDINGSIRGKAFSPKAFDTASRTGTVITDLMLALDPVDHPIEDFEAFGINSGAGDLLVAPDTETLRPLTWLDGWSLCLATPKWPDGSVCGLASRELLRSALERLSELEMTTLAAFEYEVRIRDADNSRCLLESATGSRSSGSRSCLTASRPRPKRSGSSSTPRTLKPGPGFSSSTSDRVPALRLLTMQRY